MRWNLLGAWMAIKRGAPFTFSTHFQPWERTRYSFGFSIIIVINNSQYVTTDNCSSLPAPRLLTIALHRRPRSSHHARQSESQDDVRAPKIRGRTRTRLSLGKCAASSRTTYVHILYTYTLLFTTTVPHEQSQCVCNTYFLCNYFHYVQSFFPVTLKSETESGLLALQAQVKLLEIASTNKRRQITRALQDHIILCRKIFDLQTISRIFSIFDCQMFIIFKFEIIICRT